MKTDVLIIGGGLSGLSATWQLQLAGVNVSVMEARDRFGGRILMADSDANCDLGPSWIWPGQPLIDSLLKHFTIPYFEQFIDGSVLFQQAGGAVETLSQPSPMTGARRIEGGVSRLTDAIANEISESRKFLSHEVVNISLKNDVVTVEATTPSGALVIEAKKVALAIPPRLAAGLTFMPALPDKVIQALAETPTWMAAHAKFFAVYDEPFWRKKGLCGTAMSQHGPLTEVHDASPGSENIFSLFGFVGLDAQRRESVGEQALIKLSIAQLTALFGDEAGKPKAVYLQDWSKEKFTSSKADLQPLGSHPQYGFNLQLGSYWQGKLEFISTESSYSNGGLIEGALEAGLKFSKSIGGQEISDSDEAYVPHIAKMSWD